MGFKAFGKLCDGRAGERALAEAFAPLTAKGWYPLYDRASPSGGNIDLLVVGPAGVAVIDAKSWSGAVTIDGTKLLLADRSRAKELNGVRRQVAEVEAALRDVQLKVTVRGFWLSPEKRTETDVRKRSAA